MSGAVQVVKMMIRKTTYPRVEKEVKEEKKNPCVGGWEACWGSGNYQQLRWRHQQIEPIGGKIVLEWCYLCSTVLDLQELNFLMLAQRAGMLR